MAVDDIYRVTCDASTNNRSWSVGFFVQEQDNIDTGDGLTVAEACDATFTSLLRDCLSEESYVESWHASKRYNGYNPAGRHYVSDGEGIQPGDALPNDNALYINMRQTYTDAAHNGGLYISGLSEDTQDGSKWTSTFLETPVKALTDALPGYIDAVSPAVGKWRIVIVSKTIMPWITPVGTVMDVTSAAATNRVMTQSRRRQKVKGFS